MWHPYVGVYVVCVIMCIGVCLYHPPSPPLHFPPTSIIFPQSPCSFKPVDVGHLVTPLRERFEFLFRRSFSVKHNKEFLEHIQVGHPAMYGCVLCTEWCVDCNIGRLQPQAAMGDYQLIWTLSTLHPIPGVVHMHILYQKWHYGVYYVHTYCTTYCMRNTCKNTSRQSHFVSE